MKTTLPFLFCMLAFAASAQLSDFKEIDFTHADNRARLYAGASLQNVPLLANQLTQDLPTEVEKFRAIFSWITANIKGDPGQDRLVRKKRQHYKNDSLGFIAWNEDFKKLVFKKMLQQQKTNCTGYAYLVREFCFAVGLECKIINGYGRSITTNTEGLEDANHSWNAVNLNGKWYLCDATWSSGYMDEYNVFQKEYNEGYFLTDPVYFAKNHHPFDTQWLLDPVLEGSTFAEAPLLYGEAYKQQIFPVAPAKMKVHTQKNTPVSFSLKAHAEQPIARIDLVEVVGRKLKSHRIYDVESDGKTLSFKNKFRFRGTYDVHLKANDDFIASYVVVVE